MKKNKFGRQTACPCGQSRKFAPLIENGATLDGGKCHSSKCGQKFIPPTKRSDVRREVEPVRRHVYHSSTDEPVIRTSMYRNEDGSKRFVCQHNETGEWVNGVGSAIRIPYRLPQTLEAISRGRPVLITEGEADADRAAQNGLDATTNLFGAKKWTDECSLAVRGIVAVIVADNDDVGREHAQMVEQSLRRTNASEQIVQLALRVLHPDLPAKGDLSDYFTMGGSVQMLNAEISRLLTAPTPASEMDTAVDGIDGIGLDDQIVETLPELLKGILHETTDPHERLVLLLSAMTVIGAIMPTVQATYSGVSYSPMLYLFVVGEAGSGKSCIRPSRILIEGIELRYRLSNKANHEAHSNLMALWESKGKKNGEPMPERQKTEVLLLPTDATAAVIIRSLASAESLVLFDTEADSLKSAISAKNGDASAALRQAWHHEAISQARVGNDLRVFCERPCLAIVLSGTPAQIAPLVQGAENGLASRFSFVLLPRRPEFTDPFSSNSTYAREYAKGNAPLVTRLWEQLKSRKVRVELTPDQRSDFNVKFKERYGDVTAGIDTAVTLRAGIVVVRLCMILSVLRCYAHDELIPDIIIVQDIDYTMAMTLAEQLRQNSGEIVESLRSQQDTFQLLGVPKAFESLYVKLPEEFRTSDALSIGAGLEISSATVKRCLKDKTRIHSLGHGRYKKALTRAP